MTNNGKLFSNELTNWRMNVAGLKKSQLQMSIYYKYALNGSKLVLLSYVDDSVFWYTYEDIGTWFVGTLGNIFHVNLLGYVHWFIYIRISKIKDYSI